MTFHDMGFVTAGLILFLLFMWGILEGNEDED